MARGRGWILCNLTTIPGQALHVVMQGFVLSSPPQWLRLAVLDPPLSKREFYFNYAAIATGSRWSTYSSWKSLFPLCWLLAAVCWITSDQWGLDCHYSLSVSYKLVKYFNKVCGLCGHHCTGQMDIGHWTGYCLTTNINHYDKLTNNSTRIFSLQNHYKYKYNITTTVTLH